MLVMNGYDRMDCRVDVMEGVEEETTFAEIKWILSECLANVNCYNVSIFSKEFIQ